MTIEATLERIATALESLLIVAASHPSLPTSVREAVVVAQGLVPAPAPAVTTSASTPAQAPPSKAPGKKPKPATQAAPTSTSEPATAPAASTAASPASSPPAMTVAEKTLLQTTTDQVIALANDFSRDQALAILGKRRGITRCSELKPDEVQGVLDEATAAYNAHTAAKVNSSLV